MCYFSSYRPGEPLTGMSENYFHPNIFVSTGKIMMSQWIQMDLGFSLLRFFIEWSVFAQHFEDNIFDSQDLCWANVLLHFFPNSKTLLWGL